LFLEARGKRWAAEITLALAAVREVHAKGAAGKEVAAKELEEAEASLLAAVKYEIEVIKAETRRKASWTVAKMKAAAREIG
jgi:hypothetical protein